MLKLFTPLKEGPGVVIKTNSFFPNKNQTFFAVNYEADDFP